MLRCRDGPKSAKNDKDFGNASSLARPHGLEKRRQSQSGVRARKSKVTLAIANEKTFFFYRYGLWFRKAGEFERNVRRNRRERVGARTTRNTKITNNACRTNLRLSLRLPRTPPHPKESRAWTLTTKLRAKETNSGSLNVRTRRVRRRANTSRKSIRARTRNRLKIPPPPPPQLPPMKRQNHPPVRDGRKTRVVSYKIASRR